MEFNSITTNQIKERVVGNPQEYDVKQMKESQYNRQNDCLKNVFTSNSYCNMSQFKHAIKLSRSLFETLRDEETISQLINDEKIRYPLIASYENVCIECKCNEKHLMIYPETDGTYDDNSECKNIKYRIDIYKVFNGRLARLYDKSYDDVINIISQTCISK